MTKCSQCKNQAVWIINEAPLCVECYSKFVQAWQAQMNIYMQDINYLTDSMESTVGLYGILPRYRVPQPIHYHNQGKQVYNTINVDNSVIGSINTGKVKQIEVAMNHINNLGNEELASALKELTEKIISSSDLNINLKNEIIEQISFLSSQATIPKNKQQSSVIKAIINSIKNTISVSAALITIWDKLEPLLNQVF
jgi:hypothetical protein